MSKAWGDVPMEDRKAIFEKMKAVIEEEGVGAHVTVKSLDQFVGNLSGGEMMNQCHLIIEGSFPADKKASIGPLKDKLMAAAGDVAMRCELSASIAQGDPMGEIENQTVMEGDDMVAVKHEAGQVILLDFWATWCPPCQGPMAHNQEMLEKRKAEWGDKVRIIGLSIDQDKQKLKDHVKAKGWGTVEHYWSRNGTSTADKDYGVQGVPHCLLVDTNGVIVFVGHPASRKLEEDIDALLKGDKITGAGTTRSGGDEGGEGGTPSEITEENYVKLTTLFKEGADAICKDSEMKAEAAKLQRAFFVLVVDAKIDLATMKMTGDMQCITQLFGDPAASAKI